MPTLSIEPAADPPTPTIDAIVVRETLLSVTINSAFGLAAFVLLFRGIDPVPIGPHTKLTNDFLVQATIIGFFAAFPPLLIVSHHIRKGKVSGRQVTLPAIFARAAALALASAIVFGGAGWLVTHALDGASAPFFLIAVLKALFGAVIALVITPVALQMLRARE